VLCDSRIAVGIPLNSESMLLDRVTALPAGDRNELDRDSIPIPRLSSARTEFDDPLRRSAGGRDPDDPANPRPPIPAMPPEDPDGGRPGMISSPSGKGGAGATAAGCSACGAGPSNVDPVFGFDATPCNDAAELAGPVIDPVSLLASVWAMVPSVDANCGTCFSRRVGLVGSRPGVSGRGRFPF
jgi:hypothetical protein